jgi:hypothetical protein
MPSVNLTINRANDFDESYEVYMKRGGVPLEYGDGIYVGNYPIQPWETSITFSLATPPGTTWGFSVTPIQQRDIGITGTVLP